MINKYATLALVLVATSTVLADFDGDQKNELIAISQTNGNVSYFESDLNPNSVAFKANLTSEGQAVVIGDFDNDEFPDLFVGRNMGSLLGLTWYESNGSDDSVAAVRTGISSLAILRNGLAVGDYDNDGTKELYAITATNDLLKFVNTGNNTIGTAQNIASGVLSVGVYDLDGDKKSEMFVARATGIDWTELKSDGTFWFKTIPATNVQAVRFGDIDGDSAADMLAVLSDGSVQWFEAAGNDTIPILVKTFGSNVVSATIVDVDSDGVNEVIVTRNSDTTKCFDPNANNSLVETAINGIGAGYQDLASVGFTYGNTPMPTIIYRKTVVEMNDVPDGSADIEFPGLATSEDMNGRLMLGYMFGKHPGYETSAQLISGNWGLTWDPHGAPLSWLINTELPGIGPAISLGTITARVDARTFTTLLGRRWGDSMLLKTDTATANLPFDTTQAVFHRGLILLDDNTLLATMYVIKTGFTTREVVIMQSSDLGSTWTYRSTAVNYLAWMGDEGPNESAMVRLLNGNLLLVARTGTMSNTVTDSSTVPLVYAISSDQGNTWSIPVSLGVPGVDPGLIVLEDGRVALSYGRPGVYLKFADATGTNWSVPYPIYTGAGCGYTGIAKHADGDLLVTYTESDFNNRLASFWSHPDPKNRLKIAKIAVSQRCKGQGFDTADLNFDCNVNFTDYSILAKNWLVSN
ncbi:MAG: hypothetical protein A2Y12_09635 [Planctomycetes bacterium GWF2_42_9]|nr:MAG: hypothetical protein A2Y12_09635 [Planctomycetes bacterium GWF2_42_9]